MGPPASHGVSRAPCYSGTRTWEPNVSPTGLSPSVVGLSRPFDYVSFCNPHVSRPATPDRSLVWASSFSLAATKEIDVSFYSARYLDVSVPWVSFRRSIHSTVDDMGRLPARIGFPHWEILGSTLIWQLPQAYRSLSRPSSASGTKASTMHP